MDENMFDINLDVATISAELPDPVITLSGTDRYTVQDTADYPLLALSVYGKSTQGYASSGGTPLGKNLFDFEAWKSSITSISNGTAEYGDNSIKLTATGTDCYTVPFNSGYMIPVSPNTTYTFSFSSNNNLAGTNYLFFNGVTSTNAFAGNAAGKKCTFTTASDTNYLTVRFGVLNSGESITYSNIQLEKGSTATSYEPYYSNPNPDCPVDIVSVGDDGMVEVMAWGKNLYDISTATRQLVSGDGSVVNDPVYLLSDYISCSDYDKITVSGVVGTGAVWYRIAKYDIDKNFIIRIAEKNVQTGAYTFDVSDCTYIRLCYEDEPVSDTVVKNMQVEYGAMATAYEPYKRKVATVTRGLPLCSVGDVCDELVYNADGTGKIIKRTKEVVVDGVNVKGSLMSYNSDYNTTQWNFGINSNLYTSPYSGFGTAICSHAVCEPIVDSSFTHIVPFNDNGTKYVRCWFVGIGATTTEELNVWLQSNPVTFVYQLATPQEIELSAAEMTELQKLQSYEGTTSVYNDEQAEMLVKLLRREFDMKYIEWLKKSQTWVCPKSGKWKVIAVGGGASGGMYEEATSSGATEKTLTPTTAGGTTSFGSIIAADGAPSTSDYTAHGYSATRIAVSGYGGYTGTSYGGVPMLGGNSATSEMAVGGSGNAAVMAFMNPTAAVGYGAGGGAGERYKSNYDVSPIPGRAGAIESTIVDLEEGQTILCTIGKGGQTTDATVMGSGADGVIVVQYLGY